MIPGRKSEGVGEEREVAIEAGGVTLDGTLALPGEAKGLVLFAHGSGSSRHSPRNRYVAGVLQAHGLATLLFDLLTRPEESVDRRTAELRFDIALLAQRLAGATQWVLRQPDVADLRIGYFGASTGAGAALVAAAKQPEVVAAVVSRGGRPDLAAGALQSVRAATLLIVGGDDGPVIAMNRQALAELGCRDKNLTIIPGASHLFEEPGTLEEVARCAAAWFTQYLAPEVPRPARAKSPA